MVSLLSAENVHIVSVISWSDINIQLENKLPSVEDRGHADRVATFANSNSNYDVWLTFNPRRAIIVSHLRAKSKLEGRLVQRIEWKLTDGWTDTTDRATFTARGVGDER